jgi:cell wall-associated NlpC family hydrolase/outer membrane murein-binding lipoprotein Lpp
MFDPSSRTRFRRLAAAVTSGVALLAGAVVWGGPVAADSVDDARRKVNEMADRLEAAEEEVDRLSEELRVAEDDKARLDIEIAESEVVIAAMETEVGGLQAQMSDLAVQAFVGGGNGGSLTGLLSPGAGPNEAVQRQYLTEMALNLGSADSDQLDALIDDLGDKKTKLERDRTNAEELAARIQTSQSDAADKIEEYTALKARAERELGEALAKERARRAAAAAAAARAQANALAASRASSNSGTTNTGSTAGGSGASRPRFDPSSIPASSSRGAIAVAAARSQIGVKYVKNAAIENQAFDCSGLTMWAWQQAGVSLPHQSRRQFSSSPRIPVEYIEPGDLIFFYDPITHVGIYVGDGMMVDAPGVGRSVRLTAVSWNKVVGVTRPG